MPGFAGPFIAALEGLPVPIIDSIATFTALESAYAKRAGSPVSRPIFDLTTIAVSQGTIHSIKIEISDDNVNWREYQTFGNLNLGVGSHNLNDLRGNVVESEPDGLTWYFRATFYDSTEQTALVSVAGAQQEITCNGIFNGVNDLAEVFEVTNLTVNGLETGSLAADNIATLAWDDPRVLAATVYDGSGTGWDGTPSFADGTAIDAGNNLTDADMKSVIAFDIFAYICDVSDPAPSHQYPVQEVADAGQWFYVEQVACGQKGQRNIKQIKCPAAKAISFAVFARTPKAKTNLASQGVLYYPGEDQV